MRRSLIGAALCLLLALLLWLRQPPSAPLLEREIFVMGTLLTITARPGDTQTAAAAQAQLSALAGELQRFHERWSAGGEGELGQLNAELHRAASATAPPSLLADLQSGAELCRRSSGLFDPAVGELIRLWGFDDESHYRDQPPTAAAIAAALPASNSLCLARFSDDRLQLDQAGTTLDFGAAAKGRAVGLAIEQLRAAGFAAALVNAGGDLQALGERGDRPWRIGIRHPRPQPDQPLLASLSLRDGEAVFTSGDYERYFEHQGRRYHHILDPRNGWPANGLSSATVVSADPWLADIASTVLFVAGPEQGPALMQALGCPAYMWVTDTGEIRASAALAPRLEWLVDPPAAQHHADRDPA